MYDEYGHWHDIYWYHDSWNHMGILFNVLLLLLIIFGAVYLVQRFGKFPPQGGSKQSDTAVDTLKKRYALGEISTEEFIQKKKDLEA